MRKRKVNKAVASRFRVTRQGKVLYRKAGRGHLLQDKTRKRKRSLNRIEELKNYPLADRLKTLL